MKDHGLFERTVVVIYVLLLVGQSLSKKTAEPSSTLLRMHKHYSLYPPHETSLYDTLQVLPNATTAEISKQYRKLSRQLHPDKKRKRQVKHDDEEEEDTQRLFQVQTAYEVLKQDVTRLPYHRYGLLDTGSAAAILTGCKVGQLSHISPLQLRLMEWMGYSNDTIYSTDSSWKDKSDGHTHSMRIMFLAIHLVELIRPVVEGSLSQDYFAHYIAQECDALKSLPLGSQIIRCIGRAYRYSGQRYLRRYRASSNYIWETTMRQKQQNKNTLQTATLDLTDSIHIQFRNAKNLATAAIASGRLMIEESVYSLRKKQNKSKNLKAIEYPDLGHVSMYAIRI